VLQTLCSIHFQNVTFADVGRSVSDDLLQSSTGHRRPMYTSVQGRTCKRSNGFVCAGQSCCHPRRWLAVSLFQQMLSRWQLSLLQLQNSAQSAASLPTLQRPTSQHRRRITLPSLCRKMINVLSMFFFSHVFFLYSEEQLYYESDNYVLKI